MYLSYYHCLQTVKKPFNKQKLKGHTTVLRFIQFPESRHHDTVGTQELSIKIENTVSLKRFIDGHGHNNDTLGHEQCVEKRHSFLCVS